MSGEMREQRCVRAEFVYHDAARRLQRLVVEGVLREGEDARERALEIIRAGIAERAGELAGAAILSSFVVDVPLEVGEETQTGTDPSSPSATPGQADGD